jgi:hypothetical protein
MFRVGPAGELLVEKILKYLLTKFASFCVGYMGVPIGQNPFPKFCNPITDIFPVIIVIIMIINKIQSQTQ